MARPRNRPLRGCVQRLSPSEAAAPEAEALLFDLEGASAETIARTAARLEARPPDGGPLAFVRTPLLDEGGAAVLAAICKARPDAIVATRAETGADLQHLGAVLAVEEAKAGLDADSIGIVAVAETAGALFGLIGFAPATQRLVAIGWDGEALGRDLGGEAPREADGRWSDPLQTARTLTLAAAADAKLPAIDSPFSGRDGEAFGREAERARRDGFAAKFALDPRQAALVSAVFSRG